MASQGLTARIRELRKQGLTPKQIARTLGMAPAAIAPIIRAVAAQDQAAAPEREIAGCWVSPGWSEGLTFPDGLGWPDVTLPDSGTSGLVAVVVARDTGGDKVLVCGYLADVYCLGVKDALGPKAMRRRALPEFTYRFFSAYPAPPLRAPVELARHLVFGAVEYAGSLGFPPASDFEKARDHLGPWTGPSAITFGRDGKPFYIQGPYDNAAPVMKTLERSTGKGDFHFLVGA